MNTRTVLLVEDNTDDEELTVRAFKKSSVTTDIVIARDGAEALDYLFLKGQHQNREPSIMPDLILLDLKLPKVSGLEVLNRIRRNERTRRIPVIILTSSREEVDVESSYGLGANSYICKPVDFDNFAETVKQIGSYWLRLNERLPLGGIA